MTEFSPKKRTYLSPRINNRRQELLAAGDEFLERSNILSSQPVLDAAIVVKALNGSLGTPEEETDDSLKRTSGTGVQDREAKIHFDPNGVRDEGQVLKLHVSAKDFESGQNNFGWINPPEPQSKEDARRSMEEALKWRASTPKIKIRAYEQDPRTGKPILETEEEVEVKSLGKTIRDILPGGSNLGGRAARKLGLVVDALGKFRCPPGTPAANQFTDEFGTNCFSPIQGLRSTVQGLVNRARSRGIDGWTFPGRRSEQDEVLKANLAQRRAAAEKAGHLIGTNETVEAAMVDRNFVIDDLLDQFEIDASSELNEDFWLLLEAITDPDTGDYPDLEWKELFTSMFGENLWDDSLSMRQNLLNMREAVMEDTFSFLAYGTKAGADVVKENYAAGDPTVVESVDTIVGRYEGAMRGFLGSLFHELGTDREGMASLKEVKFRPFNEMQDDFQTYWGTDGECIPLFDGRGTGLGTRLEFNPTAMALRPFHEKGFSKLDSNGRPMLMLVETDGDAPEPLKWEAIAEILSNTEKMHFFKDHFATDISSSTQGGSMEAAAMHTGYHEIAHVKQYSQIAQRVMEAYERDGQFIIPNPRQGAREEGDWEGPRVNPWKVLTSPPSEWTNEDWAYAVTTVMGDALKPGHSVDGFPPMDIVQFEQGMLHILAGDYYQKEVHNFLNATSGTFAEDMPQYDPSVGGYGSAQAHLNLMMMEGMAELYALRKTGAIAGDELGEVLDWMDEDVNDIVFGIPESEVPFIPKEILPETDMGEAPWDSELEPGEAMTPSGLIIPSGAAQKIERDRRKEEAEKRATEEKRQKYLDLLKRRREEMRRWGAGTPGEIRTTSDGKKYVWQGPAFRPGGSWMPLIADEIDEFEFNELFNPPEAEGATLRDDPIGSNIYSPFFTGAAKPVSSASRELEIKKTEREIREVTARLDTLDKEIARLTEDEYAFMITREEYDNRIAEIAIEKETLNTRKQGLQQGHSILKHQRDKRSRSGMRSIRTRKQSDDSAVAERMSNRNAELAETKPLTAFSAPTGWGDNYKTDQTSRALPPIQSRSKAVSDHYEKLDTSLEDLLQADGILQGPNDSMLEIDPKVAEFLSTHERDEISETIAKASIQYHRGFDRRPRVLLDSDEFENLLETGSHTRPDIPYGENSAADMRMDYDLRNGFDITTPASERPISGHLYHATNDDEIAERLDLIDGPLMERLPDFWDSEGTAPWGNPSEMGGDIDIVLRPEVSDRTHYGTGDAMSRGAIPVPMNSNDPDDILAAHTPRWNNGQENGPFENTKKMHDLLLAGATGNYRNVSPEGEHHEAQISGGIDLDDIEFVRYPVSKLNWQKRELTHEDLGTSDEAMSGRLRSLGFTEAEIDYFYKAINEGEITGLRNINWLRQHVAAKEAQERFDRLGVGVKFTNPDGIDLMNVDSFTSGLGLTDIPDVTPLAVLQKRVRMEIANRASEILRDIREQMKPSRNQTEGVLV